jgi:hypothetical protein
MLANQPPGQGVLAQTVGTAAAVPTPRMREAHWRGVRLATKPAERP